MGEKPVEARLKGVTRPPFLPGFPRTVVANAKRRRQAEILLHQARFKKLDWRKGKKIISSESSSTF